MTIEFDSGLLTIRRLFEEGTKTSNMETLVFKDGLIKRSEIIKYYESSTYENLKYRNGQEESNVYKTLEEKYNTFDDYVNSLSITEQNTNLLRTYGVSNGSG